MKQTKLILVGFGKGISKKNGEPFEQITCTGDTVKYSSGYSTNIYTFWVPKNEHGKDWEKFLGKEIKPVYEMGAFGRSELVTLEVVE